MIPGNPGDVCIIGKGFVFKTGKIALFSYTTIIFRITHHRTMYLPELVNVQCLHDLIPATFMNGIVDQDEVPC